MRAIDLGLDEVGRAVVGGSASLLVRARSLSGAMARSQTRHTAEPAVNLAVAAGLAAGLAIDPGEIGVPSIVIAA
jgi:hypothetical protein